MLRRAELAVKFVLRGKYLPTSGKRRVGREAMHPPAERVRGVRFPHSACPFYFFKKNENKSCSSTAVFLFISIESSPWQKLFYLGP